MADAGKPRIFIASSNEGRHVANLIKETLDKSFEDAYCDMWNDRVFEPSEVIIESLQKALDVYSYAIIVLTPDDRTTVRGAEYAAPRDNLIYELGLFTGRHGKNSVFMVTPQNPQIRLPSDLEVIISCNYKIRSNGISRDYDVGTACNQIIRAIKKIEADKKSKISPKISHYSKKFWDTLSNIVVIIFGTEYPEENIKGTNAKRFHPKISLRDLKAAQDILEFLARQYPRKQIITLSASTIGWQNLLQIDADLVIIGGFASNIEFARHRPAHQQNFRLKMGRLCSVNEQRVYHVDFDSLLNGKTPPPYNKPIDIELFPSEHVSRDFGIVYSTGGYFYGSNRRIIGIAGIKGNGTLGAAISLTRADTLDSLLPKPAGKDDLLEIVIKTDVNNNIVSRTDIVELMINGESLFDSPTPSWKPCELNRQCQGCIFGETIPVK